MKTKTGKQVQKIQQQARMSLSQRALEQIAAKKQRVQPSKLKVVGVVDVTPSPEQYRRLLQTIIENSTNAWRELAAALERGLRDEGSPLHVVGCVDNPTDRPCCWIAQARAALELAGVPFV